MRLNPKQVWKRLRKAKFGVVTLNGKPQFLLSSIKPNELEEVLYLVSRIQAEMAVEGMTRTAEQKGLDRLTLGEVDKLIEKGGKARKKKKE